jgi:hypothetical protein
MKIVINISEKDYKYIKEIPSIGVGSNCVLDNAYDAIRNGEILDESEGEQ